MDPARPTLTIAPTTAKQPFRGAARVNRRDRLASRVVRLFVALGSGLFVAALARTIWHYFGELGAIRPFGGASAVLFDVLMFSAFAAHHSLFAREPIKRAVRAVVGESAVRPLHVWIASVLLIVVCGSWRPVGLELYAVGAPLAMLIASVQVGGLLLTTF